MLALHGFDAFGLEVSQTAIDIANKYAKEQLANPSDHYHGHSGTSHADNPMLDGTGTGEARFILGDFFKRDWEKACGDEDSEQGFDLIYDYTVRIHPSLCSLFTN